jgi:hypothetical protein
LRRELPSLASEARDKWVPAITDRMRAIGLVPAQPIEPEALEPATPRGAYVAGPQAEG